MSRWAQATLGDVVFARPGNGRIIKGTLSTKNDGKLFPAYSATGQDVFSEEYDHEGDGIVLSAVGARCGKCFLATGRWRAIANTHILLPRKDRINSRFLWYLINDENFWIKGGTAQPFVKITDSLRNLIPLPPLSEQERIVWILDEADQLRRLRTEADSRTADLIPALFDEMFGDPQANPKRWPTSLLKDLAEKFSDGPFGSNLKSMHYTETGVRVVRLQNIGVGVFLDEDKAYISDNHFSSLIKHQCLPGDVLVGTLGDPNLRACILPGSIPQALNKADCVQIRPQRSVATSEYLCWLLNMPSTLQMASGLVMGQTRSRISMGRLSVLSVPVPPLEVQRAFATRVSEVHALQAEHTASRRRLDDLFQSLLHRAFQGEL